MAEQYPLFRFRLQTDRDGDIGFCEIGSWRGALMAIRSGEDLGELIDDLEHDRDVYVAHGGEILHNPGCSAIHCSHPWMDGLSAPFPRAVLEVRYRGGAADPRAFLRAPRVTPERLRHRFDDDGSICPFLSSEGVWIAGRDTVADFMSHVAIWVAKWSVWTRTGHWPGGEHPIFPPGLAQLHHLETIPADARCWCRSGEAYGGCHAPDDQRVAGAYATNRQRTLPCAHRQRRLCSPQ